MKLSKCILLAITLLPAAMQGQEYHNEALRSPFCR